VTQIQDVIKERETTEDDLGFASPNGDVAMTDAPPSQSFSKSSRRSAPQRLDKRQIEQRIEEDRERHKRERESIWAIPAGADAETNKLWEETSDFGEDDDRLLAEEEEEFTKEMELQRCSHRRPSKADRK
jgi:CTD kinase subunit gamma